MVVGRRLWPLKSDSKAFVLRVNGVPLTSALIEILVTRVWAMVLLEVKEFNVTTRASAL